MTEDNKRHRNYCFTLNNYTEVLIQNISVIANKFRYICYEKEVGEQGTPHLQGYFELDDAKTMTALQKGLLKGLRMSLRVARGNATQNTTYCSKENNNTFVEFGKPKKQGKRVDLDKLKNKIMDGQCTVDEITVDKPMAYHQYGRTLEKLEDIAMRKKYRTTMTKAIWYWGKTGVGKSHTAFTGYTPDTHYVLNINDNGWWEGYKQQKTVIINEFRGQIPFGELLDLIDKDPKTVKRRNREPLPFMSEMIIITSSMHPNMVYQNVKNTQESLDQFYRRCEVIHLNHYTEALHRSAQGGNIEPPEIKGKVQTLWEALPPVRLASLGSSAGAPSEWNTELNEKDIENMNLWAKLKPVEYEEF